MEFYKVNLGADKEKKKTASFHALGIHFAPEFAKGPPRAKAA